VDGHGKGKTDGHSAGIRFYRPVHELPDLRELFNGRDSLTRLSIREAENRCIGINVFTAGKLRIEAGAEFQ